MSENNDQQEIMYCNKCDSVPDNYICLNCNHNFCLICMAYQFLKGATQKNEENQTEYICEICEELTQLDQASVEAIDIVIQEIILNSQAKLQNKKISDSIEMLDIPATKVDSIHHTGKFKNIEDQNNFSLHRSDIQQDKKIQDYEIQDNLFSQQVKNQNSTLQQATKSDSTPIQVEQDYDFSDMNIQSLENYEAVPQSTEKEVMYCSEHPYEECALMCFTCHNQILCIKCTLDGTHRNHDVRSFQKSIEFLTQKMDETGHQINANMEILLWAKTKLAEKKRGCHSKGDRMKFALQKSFKQIYDEVSRVEKKLIQEVDDHLSTVLMDIEQDLEQIKQKTTTLIHLKEGFQFIKQKENKLQSSNSIFKFFSESINIINKMTYENEDLFSSANNSTCDKNSMIKETDDMMNIQGISECLENLKQITIKLNPQNSNQILQTSVLNTHSINSQQTPIARVSSKQNLSVMAVSQQQKITKTTLNQTNYMVPMTNQSVNQSPRQDSYVNQILAKPSKWINNLGISHKFQGSSTTKRTYIGNNEQQSSFSEVGGQKKEFSKNFSYLEKNQIFSIDKMFEKSRSNSRNVLSKQFTSSEKGKFNLKNNQLF